MDLSPENSTGRQDPNGPAMPVRVRPVPDTKEEEDEPVIAKCPKCGATYSFRPDAWRFIYCLTCGAELILE
jgi:hypothetical protein